MPRDRPRAVLLFLSCIPMAGCGAALKQRELEQVAKDWALTIRASQVIPVYPLTEDLQPGDVFLVRMPIQAQHEEYRRRGFLPLDQHFTRLDDLDYSATYGASFGIGEAKNTPRHWQFPPDGRTWSSTDPPAGSVGSGAPPAAAPPTPPTDGAGSTGDGARDAEESGERHRSKTLWHLAPRAGFPTYTFKVRSGAGAAVALPIQGVPVSLSIMQSDEATGTVTIADAYTYAVPFDKLVNGLTVWASQSAMRHVLAEERRGVVAGEGWWGRLCRSFSGSPPPTVYLRVVQRVYTTGRVMVELKNDESVAGKAVGGAEKDVDIPTLKSQVTASNHAAALKALSSSMDATIPGGTLKFAWATSRSVVMSETFARPLVIGFLGFDFPVLEDGSLGVPIATRDQLEGGSLVEPTSLARPLESPLRRAAMMLIHLQLIKAASEAHPRAGPMVERLDGLQELLPPKYPIPLFSTGPDVRIGDVSHPNLTNMAQADGEIARTGFNAVLSYSGQLEETVRAVEAALKRGGVLIGGRNDDPRIPDLPRIARAARREFARLEEEVGRHPVVVEALEEFVRILKGGP
ncbi:MAG TPA: hypothetical protein VMT52_02215 [Planctomycetota bacterium]|nr:hypothetical protein [Planctomycetota bacterium]